MVIFETSEADLVQWKNNVKILHIFRIARKAALP